MKKKPTAATAEEIALDRKIFATPTVPSDAPATGIDEEFVEDRKMFAGFALVGLIIRSASMGPVNLDPGALELEAFTIGEAMARGARRFSGK